MIRIERVIGSGRQLPSVEFDPILSIVEIGVGGRLGMFDLKTLLLRIRQTCLLMIGIPDYEQYVEHMRTWHPGRAVMTKEEFFWDRQKSRYSDGKGRMHGGCS